MASLSDAATIWNSSAFLADSTGENEIAQRFAVVMARLNRLLQRSDSSACVAD
jgi:hypothetical protein